MPHLPSLPDPAHLSDLYKRYPENVAPLMAYTDGVLRAEGELSIGERELIATFVSGLNACDFCFQSHLVYAAAFGIDEGVVEALVVDVQTANVDEKLKPLLAYVKKLNQLPSKIISSDVRAVYDAGWSERALYEAVQVCALFNMMNRIIEGTGVNFDYVANPEVHTAANKTRDELQNSYKDYGRVVAKMAQEKE